MTVMNTSARGSAVIPASVNADGKSYKVTAIAADAFRGNKGLKKVIIGKNVKTIGKNAFSGCSGLKDITISSTNLASVGSKAFKGISPKAKIKVPSARLAKYRKILKNKGQGRKVKITKN